MFSIFLTRGRALRSRMRLSSRCPELEQLENRLVPSHGHSLSLIHGNFNLTRLSAVLLQPKVKTSTALTSSASSAVFGQLVTFTATISLRSLGAGTPTGTVQFVIDGSNAGSPVNVTTASGQTTASFSTAALTVGTHTVTASYSGDATFLASSGTLAGGQVVAKAGTSTVVTSSANPSGLGQPVTFTATISVTAPGAGSPTGTVQFQIDGNNVGSPVSVSSSGGTATATFTTAGLRLGTHSVQAIYSGDGNFVGSQGSLSGGQVVNLASTITVVTSSLNPSMPGQLVTFTATVSGQGPGTPTGTVQFQIDGTNVGFPVSLITVGGVSTASYSTFFLTGGVHTVTASYSGDNTFAPSTGTLSGGQVVQTTGVAVALNAATGLLSLLGDTSNNLITIQQVSPGVLRISGDAVSPPAVPTLVNGGAYADFALSAITSISIQFLNGNDKLTLTGFSIPGDLVINAGSGSDTFLLDTISANHIAIAATGPDTVSVSKVTAASSLTIFVGAGTQAVSVTDSTVLDLTIQAHSATADNPLFTLTNDRITNANGGGLTLTDSGTGSDSVILSHVEVANRLAITLSGGINTVSADNVTAAFGSIDGGEPNSGSNLYLDGGGNLGYFVLHFVGH